jgi:3-deoxy-D-manno-octulosonate 8-phosphate phosphatase (KDO 8-P phosphatase)
MSKYIKMVVFDFDGVFTDGTIIIDNNGYVIKRYNVKDGMGIRLLKKNNIEVGVISGYKENKSQLNILKHLKINYIALGIKNKI